MHGINFACEPDKLAMKRHSAMNEEDETWGEAQDDRPTWIPPSCEASESDAGAVSEEFEAVPRSRHRFPSLRRAFGMAAIDANQGPYQSLGTDDRLP